MNEMNEINEIKIPKGVDRISVKQHDDRVVIEFIPEKRKFKAGDKVKIKYGISSKTHSKVGPGFVEYMDKFIGKELTVIKYTKMGNVECNNRFYFHEDWLEPWNDEPKNGDLAIFWDYDDKGDAIIRLYNSKYDYEFHCDSRGILWTNAIKFESKEQYEKILRGEI